MIFDVEADSRALTEVTFDGWLSAGGDSVHEEDGDLEAEPDSAFLTADFFHESGLFEDALLIHHVLAIETSLEVVFTLLVLQMKFIDLVSDLLSPVLDRDSLGGFQLGLLGFSVRGLVSKENLSLRGLLRLVINEIEKVLHLREDSFEVLFSDSLSLVLDFDSVEVFLGESLFQDESDSAFLGKLERIREQIEDYLFDDEGVGADFEGCF